MTKFIQVMTTTAGEEEAQRIADALVKARLAACVQVLGPIKSTYWWQGKVESANEWLCICKSRRDIYGQIEKVIQEEHSYDTPEILAIPVLSGSAGYLEWMTAELNKAAEHI